MNDYVKDIRCSAGHVGANAGQVERVLTEGEYREAQKRLADQGSLQLVPDQGTLPPFLLEDDRPYARFETLVHPGRSALPVELLAFSDDGDRLLMPVGVKNRYRYEEAARDVCTLCRKLFVGKTKREVESMLGFEQ